MTASHSPMLAHTALTVRSVPSHWWLEPKFDGRRFIATNEDGDWRLLSRYGVDRAVNAPRIVEALERVPRGTVLDGEVCAYPPGEELPSITLCTTLMGSSGPHPTLHPVYEVFDVLAYAGEDLTAWPLVRRRATLEAIFDELACGDVRIVPAVRGARKKLRLVQRLERIGGEGVMAKNPNAPYHPGRRSHDWLKFKFVLTLNVVFMGHNPGREFGAIRFGQYRNGVLVERGKCKAYEPVSDQDVGRAFRLTACAPVSGSLTPRLPRHTGWLDDAVLADLAWEEL